MTNTLQKMTDTLQNIIYKYKKTVNSENEKIEKFQYYPTISPFEILIFGSAFFIFFGFYLYVTIYGGKQAFDSLFSFSNWTYYIAAIVILYAIIFIFGVLIVKKLKKTH